MICPHPLTHTQLAISYLLYPAIAALLAYLAISHPEATASSIYTVLEFVKEHPAASSVGVVVAAGVLLGPDILAGSALVGEVLRVFHNYSLPAWLHRNLHRMPSIRFLSLIMHIMVGAKDHAGDGKRTGCIQWAWWWLLACCWGLTYWRAAHS